MKGNRSAVDLPQICVFDLHHQVIRAWSDLRGELAYAPKVLSFDFHTDTLSALRRGIASPGERDHLFPEKVHNAVEILHHDEHFDWALRSGLIREALICAVSAQNGCCSHEKMSVRSFPEIPDINELFRDTASFRDVVKDLLSDENIARMTGDFLPGNEEGFILDVDCDFFLTEEMLSSVGNNAFSSLVRKCSLITLSRESDWVRLLRFPGETLTGDSIADFLEKKFTQICEET